jgi:hypothetical protein
MRLVLSMILSALTIAQVGVHAAAQDVVSVPVWAEGLGQAPRVRVSIGSYQGLPYSAKSTVTSVGPRSDNSVVAFTQETLLYRDAEGRTRSEITRDSQIMTYRDRQGNSRTMDVTQMYGGGKHSVTVADPVEGITFSWTIDEQSAKKQVRVVRSAPRPPKNPTQTDPANSGPQEKDSDRINAFQSPRHHIEALGTQTVNGLYAEGYRETTLDRDPSTGTDKTATTEQWLSPDLKIVVRRIETDQRFANESSPQGAVHRTELTDIGRSDPDPELFKLPKGYEAVDSFSGAPIVQTQDTTNIAPFGSKDKPVRVSSAVMAGLLLHKVDPAQDSGISGSVLMAAVIDDQGKITNLFVISGPEKLRDAALEAVNQWTYKPYLLNGKPVFVQTNITTNFNLAK